MAPGCNFLGGTAPRTPKKSFGSIGPCRTNSGSVRQDAAPEFDACAGEKERLERQIAQVNVLHAVRGPPRDQIPLVGANRIQNVRAGVTAAECERGFIQTTALAERLFGQ